MCCAYSRVCAGRCEQEVAGKRSHAAILSEVLDSNTDAVLEM